MTRGVVVQDLVTNQFMFFLSKREDGTCSCAIVEEIFDDYESVFNTKVTSIRKDVKLAEIKIAENYPKYFDQITIS